MPRWLLASIVPWILAACTASPSPDGPAEVLLFSGRGTSPNDVAAIEHLLRGQGLGFSKADSSRLDRMTDAEMRAYRLMIVPGGNFVEMGNALGSNTPTRMREAVRGGLNYLGICGGAFLAGNSPYNGLNLTSGVRFPFYSAEDRGIRKAAVVITTPGSPPLEHYWEDGPQLTGWGEVVAKYPDGTPAVTQGTVGKGWVILSGVHPEAPDSWRQGMIFSTSADAANAYAVTLIDAALTRRALPHY